MRSILSRPRKARPLLTPALTYSLITEWRIQRRVEDQFNSFIVGFNELIPQELINVFDERELELLIGGIGEVDVDDWVRHTDYRSYTGNDQVIQWFWQAVRSWPAEKKSRLLQFTVSLARVCSCVMPMLTRALWTDRHFQNPCWWVQGSAGQ